MSLLNTPDAFLPLIVETEDIASNALTLVFRGDELLVREADLSVVDFAAGDALEILPDRCHPVGILNGQYFRTSWVERDASPAAGYAFRKLRSLFGAIDDQLMAIAGRGHQIAEWARTHRYCGACAAKTVLLAGERCMKCPQCGMQAYPRISPAMMVSVSKGNAILLARNAISNRFSALAGFLEPGESAEEAVHREVFEEVGLKVHNLRYFGTQSWPFPHSLMIAYKAEYLSGEIRVDENEIAEAHWYGPGDSLPEYASKVSISRALIDAHLAELAELTKK